MEEKKNEKKGMLRRMKDWFSKKFVIGAFALGAATGVGAQTQDVEASPHQNPVQNLRQVEVAEPRIPGATPDEIAYIKAINQQKHNLRIQKIEAMHNHDKAKEQEISARLIELDMQSNSVLAPIRQRQAEMSPDKNASIDPNKMNTIMSKDELKDKVNPKAENIKRVPDTLTDSIKVEPKTTQRNIVMDPREPTNISREEMVEYMKTHGGTAGNLEMAHAFQHYRYVDMMAKHGMNVENSQQEQQENDMDEEER